LQLEGVFSVLPTPFLEDGALDLASLRRVVDLYIAAGVNGLTALGVTGEVARLTEGERAAVLQTVVAHVNGRVPVVAGTSADGLRLCIEYTKSAHAAGASAVMVSPPRGPKLNSEAVIKHYASLAQSVDIPIVIQDYPPVAGFSMEPALLARIAREVPSARTIKLEDPPTPFKTARILQHAEGIRINILGGLGGVFLLEELISGAAGVMTGFAYPEILVEVVKAYRAGDLDRAGHLFYGKVALMRFEFQEGVGMSIRKEMLRRRGAIDHATIRTPGAVMDSHTHAALDRILNWAFPVA
jgi:4-hydroxy-tetrahydrodipicolinate synthase